MGVVFIVAAAIVCFTVVPFFRLVLQQSCFKGLLKITMFQKGRRYYERFYRYLLGVFWD